MASHNSTRHSKTLKPCRDGYDCLLQYENLQEHNANYSHPCRWRDQCRDLNRNEEHTRQFTHDLQSRTLCNDGSVHCTKLTDPEHRQSYRHEGLPDFLIPCKHREQCYNRSNEHLKKYKHPSSVNKNTQNLKETTTNKFTRGSNSTQSECRYGAECRKQTDLNHTSRFSHSSNKLSISSTSSFTPHQCAPGDDMQQAYRIGGALALEKLSHADQKAIQNMPQDAVIIVPGTYDHIDQVLNNLNIKYITVNQNDIFSYPFRNNQTVYINCASSFPLNAAQRLRTLVENGLHIITTDWALTNVLQVAFSDFVRHNGQATGDEVVGIQVVDHNHPLVNGFLSASGHSQPQWWLERSSHPIEIVNKSKVRVLIRSEELGNKYHSDVVLITFDCGKGNVIHMISHFYLQRSETRDNRHKMSSKQYAMDIKASPAVTNLVETQGQNLNYAQIQSSSTSAQFIYNQLSNRLNPKH